MTSHIARTGTERTNIQNTALAVGIVFLLVGILGFVPGITTNYDQLSFASHHSEAMLLGVFQVSILHNIVHLLFGFAGIAVARTRSASKNYLLWGGVIYLLLWIYGLVIGHDSVANFVPVNDADNWLHLVLGLGMISLAVLLTRKTDGGTRRTGHANPNHNL
jgi:arginine exporter protein ArgO